MTNYKQILADLSSIAYHHPQINSFGFGDLAQITMDINTKKEPRYTRMYVLPQDVTLNQNVLTYQFDIIICDQVNADLSNQRDVMSDTLETAKDIWTILYQSYTQQYGNFSVYYEPDFGSICNPFLERFETILAGWTLSITINQPFDYNDCVLPFSGLSLPQSTNYVNYKQVIADFKEIARAHEQINSFGYGDLPQITNDIETKKEPRYTKMYVVPGQTTLAQNELLLNFSIVILDQIDDDYKNQQDVLNDCLEICKDIFTVLYLSEYETLFGATCTPFLERFETTLGGFTLNVTLSQPHDYNRCVLPEDAFNYPWEQIALLWEQIQIDWENL